MDARDIEDSESLESWLAGRSVAEAICIAQRAALREFPLVASSRKGDWDLSPRWDHLAILRVLISSGVMSKLPSANLRAATKTAAIQVQSIGEDMPAAALMSTLAAMNAGYAAASTDKFVTNSHAVQAGSAEAEEFWAAIRADAASLQMDIDPSTTPIWPQITPNWFAEADYDFRTLISLDSIQESKKNPWDFWLRWWDGMLAGKPLDWELQRDVALIQNDDWPRGPTHIAELIADIELRHAITRTPNAEVITLNPTTGMLRAEPVSRLSGKNRADVVDTLRDAARVFDAQGGPNGPYGALADECLVIMDACERYADRPLMLLRTCRRVVQRTLAKEANGDCPKNDPLVKDFLASVSEAAADLLAFDPDVREAEEMRAIATLLRPSPKDAKAIVDAADRVATIAEGDLREELGADARTAVGEVDNDDRRIAAYVTKSRLLRIAALAKATRDHVERHAGVYSVVIGIIGLVIAL